MSQNVGSEGSGSRVWIHAVGLTGLAALLLVIGSAAVLRERDASVGWGLAMYVGILGMPAALFGPEGLDNQRASCAVWFAACTHRLGRQQTSGLIVLCDGN